MKKIILLLILIIFINGCSQKIVCNKPYILVGTECCLDNNDNTVCDKDEVLEKTEEKPSEQKKLNYTLAQIEIKLNEADDDKFQNYVFRKQEGDSFKKRYEIYESLEGRDVFLVQIKNNSDYINDYEAFYDFVNRDYKKKNENLQNYTIAQTIQYSEDAGYHVYGEHFYFLKSLDPKGRVLYQGHGGVFAKELNDEVVDAGYYNLATIWCTPEWIIEVYPKKSSDVGIRILYFEEIKKIIYSELNEEGFELKSISQKFLSICQDFEGESEFSSNDSIRVYSSQLLE